MSRIGSEGEDIIGGWSEEKLDLLARYLKAYSDIMNNQKTSNNPTGRPWLRSYYYVDAFAGSVRPRAKEEEERYIDGSPLRALQTEPKFDGYWFIDLSSRRAVLRDRIIPRLSYSSRQRAFIFLDPYGLQVGWDTIRELAETKTCDIFINFSVMGVTRLLPREQSPDPEAVQRINRVMGSTDWITQIYREPAGTQLGLFGEQETPSPSRETIPAEWLAKLYTQQLKSLFPNVSKPVLMKNSTNSVLYALCMASHNKTAIDITNDIFSRYYDQLG
jgi:hypothetical protein